LSIHDESWRILVHEIEHHTALSGILSANSFLQQFLMVLILGDIPNFFDWVVNTAQGKLFFFSLKGNVFWFHGLTCSLMAEC